MDSMICTPADNVTLPEADAAAIITKWNDNKKYYSLNVDIQAPELNSTTTGTQFSNGAVNGNDITVTGTCYDTHYKDDGTPDGHGSDIDNRPSEAALTVSVKIGDATIPPVTATITKTNAAGEAINPYTWTATIPASALTGIAASTIPEGKTFNIDATLKDFAGLKTSSTVAVLQKDTEAPGASLISITPSSERTVDGTSNYYIRPTQDNVVVKGNTDDTYSTAVETYLKLVPYTVSGSTEIDATSGIKYIGINSETPSLTDVKTSVTDVTPKTERNWTITIPKETFALSVEKVKIYACTKDLSGNEAATPLARLVFDETGPAFYASYSVGGRTAASLAEAAYLWHRNSNLSVKGYWTDAAGVNTVYYKLLQDDYDVEANPPEYSFNNSDNSWTPFTGSEGTNGNYNFENTIDDFQPGYNYLYMYAVDKLGNAVSQLSKLTIKVDSDAPTATDGYTDSDDQLYRFTNIYLTNGQVDKTLYYYVDEDPQNTGKVVSGIKRKTNALDQPDDVTVKLAGLDTPLTEDKYTITLSDIAGSNTKKLVTVTLDKSVLTGDGHRAVKVTLKDYAGNSVDTTIGTINMDTTAPVVRLNALKDADSTTAITEVNNTIIIKGTATDAYLKERPLTALQYKTDAADSDWADLITNYTTTNTNLVNAGDFSITLDTTQAPFTDGTTYYVRAKVMDQAGNPGWSTGTKENANGDFVPAVLGDSEYTPPLTFKVDQDTDRPVIKFTNLQLPATAANATTEAEVSLTLPTVTLKGSITDDDDLDKDENGEYTADSFQIHLIPKDDDPNAVPVEIEDTIQVNSGAWSYTFTSDGEYDVVFKVKDGAGTQFTAAATTTAATLQATPKLTDGTNWLGRHTAGSHTEFSLMVDTKAPVTQNMEFKLSEVEGAEWASSLPKLGGPTTRVENNKFLLRLVAADENGIASVVGILNGDEDHPITASQQETNYYSEIIQSRPVKCKHFIFPTIDVSGLTTGGSYSLELTITDGAGLDKQETITLNIDRDAPEVTIVKPTTNSLESASVWASGTISGAKDQGLRYAISTHGDNAHKPSDDAESASVVTAWEEYNDTTNTSTPTSFTSTYKPVYSSGMNFGITWDIYFDNATTITTDKHDKLLNQYLVDMGITTNAALRATDSSQFNKLVKLYLWLKAEDEVGNVSENAFPIILDPQGDRPTLSFTYPAENGAMLGGKVTVYGTVEDTLGDNPGVDSVWVQPISATHWKVDPSDSTQLIEDTSTGWGSFTANTSNEITAFTLTTKDLDYLASNGYHVYNMQTYKGDGTDVAWTAGSSTVATGYTVNDYAAKASLSGTAWLLDINEHKEFNPTGTDPSSVAMRLYARDNDGKFSIKFDRLVKFDANKPVISNLKLVQYDNETSFNITASQSYGNNIFVKGVWWLTGTVTDGDKVGSLTINGDKLVETNEDTQTITPVANKAWWATGHSTTQDVVEFRYKLATGGEDTVGELSVNIIAKDAAEGTPNEQNETLTVKYDNKAPEIADATTGREISKTVQQYNGFYKFSSKATEADVAGKKQSGFAYTAFFFKRHYGTTTKLYDVLQARANAEYDISTETNADTIPELGSEGTVADNTIVTKDGLYWFVKNITTNNTMSVTMSNTANIHKNSLVLIGGTYYLADGVGSGTVTFTRTVPSGNSKAYVALAGVVNNSNEGHTDGAKPQWPGNGYYAASALNRDDGDFMIEDVSKLDTTWTWEANICSRNIPDGPIDIVYVVYDLAGNSRSDTVSGYVCNNQPRIAGVTIKTDYTGNNVAEYEVTDYSAAELSEDSVTGEIGTAPNAKNVYDPFANSLTKNDEYPLSQTMTAGTAANPVLKVRGLTQIIPEIVGGNGTVYYSYSIENTTKTLADDTHPKLEGDGSNTTTALYSETDANHTLNYDYTINDTAPINLQLGDLVYLGDTTTGGIPFKFTFKDETEGLSTLTAAQKTALETEHGIKFEADLTVYLAINACQETWPSASIKPFFWDSLTENSIYDSENATSYKNLKGHIELEKDWTKKKTESPVTYYSAYDGNASGTYLDADPKVSGEIVLKGTAFDAKLLKKIEISINGVNREVATYNTTSGLLVSNYAADDYGTNGISFIIDDQTVDSTGHSVEWTLNWNTQNTSFVSTTAKKDVEVKVIATNGGVPKRVVNASGTLVSVDGTTKYLADQVENVHSNTIGDTPVQTGSTKDAQGNVINTAFYRMDVVPYIRSVKTSLSFTNEDNQSVYNRSAQGHYPVYVIFRSGEDEDGTATATNYNNATYEKVRITGFNMVADTGTNKSIVFTGSSNNTAQLTAVTGQANTFDVTIPKGAKSGNVTVTVSSVSSLNNLNNDEANGTSGKTTNNPTGDADIYGTYFYNRQPNNENNNRLTDDIYFDVWDLNSRAAVSKNNSTKDIMMKVNPNSAANGLIDFAFCDGDLYWSMAKGTTTSYTYWAYTRDFMQCTGFGVAPNGNTYGLAAGGESGSTYADTFNLFLSKWDVATGGYTYSGSKSNRIGFTAVGDYDNLAKDRFKSPCVVSNGGYVYVAYYDLLTGELRFQGGQDTTTNKGNIGTLKDSYGGRESIKTLANEHGVVQVVADNAGNGLGYSGQYVSIGIASNRVVMAWYDSHNGNLMYAYSDENFTPGTGVNSTGWHSISAPLLTNAGLYCQLVVDSDNHVHIACQDIENKDLMYVYLSDYKATTKKYCTVDSYQSIGAELTIDVAKQTIGGVTSQIPYIGYSGTLPLKPRYAYLKDPARFNAGELDGVDKATDLYTGVWECTIVPTVKIKSNVVDTMGRTGITEDKMRRINVGVWKRNGVLAYSTADGTATGTVNQTASYAKANEGKCYGNGSNNGVLAYGVKYSSTQDVVETAQMR